MIPQLQIRPLTSGVTLSDMKEKALVLDKKTTEAGHKGCTTVPHLKYSDDTLWHDGEAEISCMVCNKAAFYIYNFVAKYKSIGCS